MDIEIIDIAREYCPEYSIYDDCDGIAIGMIKAENVMIPLYADCINDIMESLTKIINTTHCYNCEFFIMSNSGPRYGGSCRLKSLRDGVAISEKDAGFSYRVECNSTCPDAVPKNNKPKEE